MGETRNQQSSTPPEAAVWAPGCSRGFHGLHRRVTVSVSRSRIGFLRFVCVNRDGVSVSCVSRFGSDPTCDTVIYGTKLGHKTHTG